MPAHTAARSNSWSPLMSYTPKSPVARNGATFNAAKKLKRERDATAEASAALLAAASPDEGSLRDQPSADQGCAQMDWRATDAAAVTTGDAALDASTVAPADRTRGAATEGHAPGEALHARQLPTARAAPPAPAAASAALTQTVAVHLLQRYTNRFLSDYNLHLALQLNRAVRLTAARRPPPSLWQSNLPPADIFIDERSLLGRRTLLAISSYLSRYRDFYEASVHSLRHDEPAPTAAASADPSPAATGPPPPLVVTRANSSLRLLYSYFSLCESPPAVGRPLLKEGD